MKRSTVVLFLAAVLACGNGAREEVIQEPSLDMVRLKRGRYLVEGVMHCFMCHSEVDWQAQGAPPLRAKKGAGAIFPEERLPFELIASNITTDPETGIGAWSDEELGKAIREGVSRDGRRLFPVMPYMLYRSMSDEDLAAVITYLRSIPPVRNELPKNEIPPPIAESLPPHRPITESIAGPDLTDVVEQGKYLATLGNCFTCHTGATRDGRPIPQLAFAGGFVLKGPWGEVAGSNITPDPSGIPYYDESIFTSVMRKGKVQARNLNVIMPWGYFRNLSDDDLQAIFAFLQQLPQVKHRVDNTEPPTACPRCGARHGLGADNESL